MPFKNELLVRSFCWVTFCSIFILFYYVWPVGFNNAVTREALIRFPYTGAGGNTILGFAALDAGYIIADQTTSFTYSSFFPINSMAAFNGGTGYLLEDLTFSSGTDMVSSGTVMGLNRALSFMQRSGPLNLSSGGKLFSLVNTQLMASSKPASLSWFSDNYVVVGGDDGNRIRVYQRAGNVLNFLGSTAPAGNMDQVAWYPLSVTGPSYYIASAFTEAGTPSGLVPYKYTPNNTWVTGTGVMSGIKILGIAWNPVSPYDLAFTRTYVGTYGFNSATGQFTSLQSSRELSFTPIVRSLAWNSTGTYLAVGGKNASGKVTIYSYIARTLSTSPVATYDLIGTSQVNAVCWSPDNSMLAVGSSGGTQNLTIYSFNGSSLTEIISYEINETRNVNTIDWAGNFLAIGRGETGQEIRVFFVDQVNKKLLLNFEYSAGGGALPVPSIGWSRGGTPGLYLASVDSNQNLNLYTYVSGPFVFDNVNILARSSILLKDSLRFQGLCSLNLNGNVLDLNGNAITLINGSSLVIQNAIIRQVTGTNILCASNAGLSLDKCTLVLSGNTQFNSGSLDIYGNVALTGQYVFTYGSSQKCTVHANSQLFLDAGLTFSYSSSSQDRISFENRYATMYLYESLLNITSNSLRLTDGTVSVEGQCNINASAGLYLGNGILANNIRLNVLPESGLNIVGGTVYNQNIY